MVEQKIKEYIDQTRKANYSDAQIRQSLKKAGWDAQDLDDALGAPNLDLSSPQSDSSKSLQSTSIQNAPIQISESKNKTNILAIFAIIYAFLIPLIGLILGIIAKKQIKKTKEMGKGLATSAIAISIILIIVYSLVILLDFVVVPNRIRSDLKIDNIEKQRIAAFFKDCDSILCLESKKIDLSKNDAKNVYVVINNTFDCDLSNVNIIIGGSTGGSTNFPDSSCQIIPTEGGKCSDIVIQSIPTKNVIHKTKELILIRIKAKSSAKNTVYSYDIAVKGSCQHTGITYNFDEKSRLDINVES